jgi:F0F1-type ATP synthase assembly protein I
MPYNPPISMPLHSRSSLTPRRGVSMAGCVVPAWRRRGTSVLLAATVAAGLVLGGAAPVLAQTTPTTPTTPAAPATEGLTLSQTLLTLSRSGGDAPIGEAIALATALDVSTSWLPTASPGFVYKVDPTTGLRVRQSTSFGPSFGHRALTSGEGKVAAYASVSATSYERLGDMSLDRLALFTATGPTASATRRGLASLVINSETLTLSGSVGVTDRFDLAVSVPMVRVKVDGIAWTEDGAGNVYALASGTGTATGLGDIAVTGKFRLSSFGQGPPDPGGFAVVGTMRLPTGDREHFRGLGISRTMGSLVYSSGTGRFRPHASAGFEFWSDGIDLPTDATGRTTITARHQVQYNAGVELEATPKVTILADFLGRHILGGGKIGYRTDAVAATSPLGLIGATSVESMVGLDKGIQKLVLVPGVKVNIKGNLLLSLSALATLRDTGLHDRIIPVAGLEWSF